MTATAGKLARPVRQRGYRWLRLVIPFIILGTFWAAVGVVHSLEQPDLADPGTMSPTGTGPDGSSRLAARLAADGVAIERVTSTLAAMQAAARSDATIFVPTPDFLTPMFAPLLKQLPGEHRVVVVKPGFRGRLFQQLPFFPMGERWATGIAAPRCGNGAIMEAGPASVRRTIYEAADSGLPTTIDCYGGAVVGVRDGDTEFVVVGATEPLRNERIGEAGNEALAAILLSEHGRVIWLDVHALEPVNIGNVDLPAAELPQYRRGEADRSNTGNPLIDAFPSGLWAILVLGVAATVLLAIARARRLGGPVAEPLPVLVPAAEAVTGRGRLYRRIQARDATLDALRTSAIRRLARVLNPFGAPALSREELVAQVAQRTGRVEPAVTAILYGPVLADDDGLAAAVDALDDLVAAVLRDPKSENIIRDETPAHQHVAGTDNQGGPA